MPSRSYREAIDTGMVRLVVATTEGGLMARVMDVEGEGDGADTLSLTPTDAATMGAMLLRATAGIAPLEPGKKQD